MQNDEKYYGKLVNAKNICHFFTYVYCSITLYTLYFNFNEYYLYELNRLNLEKEAIENDKASKNSLNWMNRILKLGYIDELNRNIVKEFINNIYVYNDKKIKIDFRFSNQYEEAIMYLKKRDNMV